LKKYFQTEGESVGAVIVEAIQGVGGINVAMKAFYN
jgi:4-aminobutyrate aminotransferase-like enzyme